MKKLVTLLAAAGMVVAASAPASAVDIKVDARYRTSFMTGETGFTGVNKENVCQRLRLGLTMAASENLSGYVNFQTKQVWGVSDDTNGEKDGKNFQTRMLYLDWKVPGTAVKVRMGRQNIGLPADAFGANAVMHAGWGTKDGVAVTAPVADWLALNALWVRVGTEYDTTNGTVNADLDQNSNNDFYAVAANLKFNGISGSVYGAYASLDDDASKAKPSSYSAKGGANFKIEEGDAYWVGATATLSYFDPFTLKLSAAYGSFEATKTAYETAGWNVQAKASYKTAFGTPVLGAWYFSGMDDKGDGLMPSLTGYFTPTRTWNDAAKGLNGGQAFGIPTGNWGVQAGIEGVSFLQGLTHDFLVSYIEGTNDKDWEGAPVDSTSTKYNEHDKWLTEDDSLVSFDFISTYQIYKNLAAHLELSYIISDIEDRADAPQAGNKDSKLSEDDWRAELTFEYKF